MTNTFTIAGSSPVDYIHEYTEQLQQPTFGTQGEWENGLKFFRRDSDLEYVNRISDTEFEIVSTGEKVHIAPQTS